MPLQSIKNKINHIENKYIFYPKKGLVKDINNLISLNKDLLSIVKKGLKMGKTDIKTFSIIRNNDESGVSGVGHVLDGIVFSSGKTVVCWRTNVSSISVYDDFDAFKNIHIDSHPTNETEIIWHS